MKKTTLFTILALKMRIGGHGDDCNDGDTDRIDLGVENKGIHDFAPFFLHIQVFMQVFIQTICACLRYRTDRTGKGKRKKAKSTPFPYEKRKNAPRS